MLLEKGETCTLLSFKDSRQISNLLNNSRELIESTVFQRWDWAD